MLEKIKLLLGLTDESRDEILTVLIAMCKDDAIDFCNLTEYTNKLDSAVIAMVIERYNKTGTEGCTSVSYNGVSQTYLEDYSEYVLAKLRKHRKVKCV
mgnify:CR=1 FL=1|jgi:hypothetical protein